MKPRPVIGRKPRPALLFGMALLSALLASADPRVAGAPATGSPAAGTRLDLRAEPFVDYYAHVRYLANRPDSLPVPEAFAPAVKGAVALASRMGTPVGWAVVDTLVLRASSAADFRQYAEALPDSLRLPGSPPLPRTALLDFADSLRTGESHFRETLWPGHAKALDAASARLTKTLLPRWDKVLAFQLRALLMSDPHVAIPVYLVHDLPEPGAYTMRRRGGGVVFVAVADLEGSLLLEVVIHETTHALDLATAGQDHLLHRLRGALAAAGMGPTDRATREIPHAVIFFQSAETVRRLLVKGHVAYGKVRGVYDRMSNADRLAPVWAAYLNGKMTPDEVVAELVRVGTTP